MIKMAQLYIPFCLSRRGCRFLPLPFFPAWETLHRDFVYYPLNVLYCLPRTKSWSLRGQSSYLPRKCHDYGIEPCLSIFMERAPVLVLRYLVVEWSVIWDPPSRLESDPPCHKKDPYLSGSTSGGEFFFLLLIQVATSSGREAVGKFYR